MFIALATAAVAMVSCQSKEEYAPESANLVRGSFCVSDAENKDASVKVTDDGDVAEEPATKTTLSSDGKTVVWSAADSLSVFDVTGRNNSFVLTSGAGTSNAKFDGSFTKGSEILYAIYPQDSTATISGSVISTTIPAKQTAIAKSFADDTNISVGIAKPDPVTNTAWAGMKNAAMYFKFKIPSDMSGVTSVKLTANGGVNLAGKVSVDAAAEAPVATVVSGGSNSITLSGTLSAGQTYYMVSAVTNLTSGFSITVTSGSNSITRSTTKSFTGARAKVFDLSDLAFSASLTGSIVHNYDSSNYLTGSTMTITPSFPNGGITSWSATIKDKNGVKMRTASGTSATATVTSVVSGKPYLPNTTGPYTVDLTCQTSNGTTVTKTNIVSIAAPKPTFTVTADYSGSYTSYEKYEGGYLSEANDLNGKTIYGLKASVTITNEVLAQLNSSIVINSDKQISGTSDLTAVSECSTNTYGPFDAGLLPNGERTIKVGETFDGVTKYAASYKKTLSGIPSSYEFNTAVTGSEWKTNSAKVLNQGNEVRSGLRIRYYYKPLVSVTDKTCDVYSAPFTTTSGTKVSYTAEMRCGHSGSIGEDGTITGYVGITSSNTSISTTVTKEMGEDSNCLTSKNYTKFYYTESNVEMPNGYMVSFAARHTYTTRTTEHFVILHSFSINYEAR